jgi:hypothetical protein
LKYKNSGELTVELLDTENADMDENEVVEIEKWSEYIEKYCNDNQISDEFKDALVRKPVFLTRFVAASMICKPPFDNRNLLLSIDARIT